MKRIVLIALVAAVAATVTQSAIAASGGLTNRAQSLAVNEAGHGALAMPALSDSGPLIAGEPKYDAPFTNTIAGSHSSSGVDWIEITLVATAVLFVGAVAFGLIRLGHASMAKPVA
jgi:hypothetical protein